jgi:hypothetical protein
LIVTAYCCLGFELFLEAPPEPEPELPPVEPLVPEPEPDEELDEEKEEEEVFVLELFAAAPELEAPAPGSGLNGLRALPPCCSWTPSVVSATAVSGVEELMDNPAVVGATEVPAVGVLLEPEPPPRRA